MATLKEPFALDRSLNTTEVTPRNIADVLAEGLSHITGRTASEVEYDNTDSGLTADNVQDALDEIAESVPTLPTTDIQTAVDEFETYNGGLLSECNVTLESVQDLHGYPNPWVGGAGKNKAPLVDKTGYGLTFVADELLGKMTMTGTATGDGWGAGIMVQINLPVGSYICSATNNPNNAQVLINYNPQGVVTSSGVTFNVTDATQNIRVAWLIASGTTYNNVIEGLMIRSATETAGFEPYSNICPITGHTQVEVDVSDGVNKINPDNMGHYGRDNATGQIDRTDANMSSTTNLVKVDPSTTYTIARNGTKYVLRVYYYGVDKSYIGNEVVDGTFTTPNNVYYIAWQSGNASGALDLWCMVEGSSSAYVPYNGYQVTVNLGGTYYGGVLDVVSGILVAGMASVDLGTLTWTYDSGTQRFTSSVTGLKNLPVRTAPMTCEVYKVIDDGRAIGDVPDGSIYNGNNSSNVYVHDSRFTVPSDLATALSGYKLVYPLATPTTIQLSPTMVKALVGENHLSAPLDGQEITESKYKQLFTFDDVIAYIQSIS